MTPATVAPIVIGVLVVVVALVDMGQTVVSVSGKAGALTRRMSASVWRAALWFHHRSDREGRLLTAAGPLILITVILTWIVLLVLGWSLVFGAPQAVIEAELDEPTALLGRVYYASSLVVGRGSPGFRPGTEAWRAVEQVAALSGLALLSLAIAYVLAVVRAVVDQRRTAAYIATLGGHPEEVLHRAWSGEDFGHLDLHLIAVTPMINAVAEQHLAYPVVHYFHSRERHSAIGPNIAVLDEVLTVLGCCAADVRLGDATVEPLRWAISEYLDTVIPMFVLTTEAEQPPRPAFGKLETAGVPVRAEDDIDAVYASERSRRMRLNALVRSHGWDWETVAGTETGQLEVAPPGPGA